MRLAYIQTIRAGTSLEIEIRGKVCESSLFSGLAGGICQSENKIFGEFSGLDQ